MKVIVNGETLDTGGMLSEALQELLSSKQDKLTGTQGQVVGFDASGTAQAVGGWSNPNLLDNWYFADPINQRGQTEYVGMGYAIDRWRAGMDGLEISLENGFIKISNVSDDKCVFLQSAEGNVLTECEGRQVTYSVLAYSTGGNVYAYSNYNVVDYGTMTLGKELVPAVNDFTLLSVTYEVPLNLVPGIEHLMCFSLVSGASLYLKAAKFEPGSVQTLAHQDVDGKWVVNEIPNKAFELAKCQRYFLRIGGHERYSPVGNFVPWSTESGGLWVSTPSTLRASPTITINGTFECRGAGSTINVTIVDPQYTTFVVSPGCVCGNLFRLDATFASGNVYNVITKTAESYVEFSADL